MLSSKRSALKSLLESKTGLHLTIYVKNDAGFVNLKAQLRTLITQAKGALDRVLSPKDANDFFEPFDSLLSDPKILRNMKGNIGLFRNSRSFRVLNIPVDLSQSFHIATSFHVKPLLKWMQRDQEFLLLGIENATAHLYMGSQNSLKLVDSVLFPLNFSKLNTSGDYASLKTSKKSKSIADKTFVWISDWINQMTLSTKPKLFLAGDIELVKGMLKNLNYKNTIKTPVTDTFGLHNVHDICLAIRQVLRKEAQSDIEKTLNEFRFADSNGRTKKNIFQISRAVVQGRVRKLVVTDEISIFGKIDRDSGGLAVHPYDLDHEDDDILDDLAQIVLDQGGEVIVASRDDIPHGRPILAILDDDEKDLEKSIPRNFSDRPTERLA